MTPQPQIGFREGLALLAARSRKEPVQLMAEDVRRVRVMTAFLERAKADGRHDDVREAESAIAYLRELISRHLKEWHPSNRPRPN